MHRLLFDQLDRNVVARIVDPEHKVLGPDGNRMGERNDKAQNQPSVRQQGGVLDRFGEGNSLAMLFDVEEIAPFRQIGRRLSRERLQFVLI